MFFQRAFEGVNDWWRWMVTIIVVLFAYAFGQLPFTAVYLYYVMTSDNAPQTPEEMQELATVIDMKGYGMDLNLGLFLLMLMFVCMGATLMWFLKLMHKRHWKTLITPLKRINWSKVFFSFFLWLAFSIGLEIFGYYSEPESYTLTFEWTKFLPLLVIVILLMPIQTSTEELFFRGYLMQGIGILTRNKLLAVFITSLLFGLMHMMNPEVKEFGWAIMLTYYVSVGFFMGLITVMDDSLELALGVHAATNMFSALFMSYEGGVLQTHAIFNTEVVNVGLMLPVFYVMASIFFIICWRKYQWEGWSKLLEPIQKPEPILPEIDHPEAFDASDKV